MEYHLYRSDVLGNIKTYYCSFDVAINESPVDVVRRYLLNDFSNDAYIASKYNPVTKSLFIDMCIPHAVGGEQGRFEYFIITKDDPSNDVEEVEETYKGGFTNSQIQKIANKFTMALRGRLLPGKRVEVEETRRILKEVVENKIFYEVRLMQDDHNKAGAITYMGVYAEDSEEAVNETIRRLGEYCKTHFKGDSYFYKGKLQTDDGEVDIAMEHHVEDNYDIPMYHSWEQLSVSSRRCIGPGHPQKWSVRIYKIEKNEIGVS